MNGIAITAAGSVFVKEFGEPTLKALQEAVGGYIEIVKPRALPAPFVMVVNEEGLLLDLPWNYVCSAMYSVNAPRGIIAGDAVILKEGVVDGEPDIVGLSDEDLSAVSELVAMYNIGPGMQHISNSKNQNEKER